MIVYQQAFMCPACSSRLWCETQGWYASTILGGNLFKYKCTNCSWTGYIVETPPEITYNLIPFPGVTVEEGIEVEVVAKI